MAARVGIGITTHNRNATFRESFKYIEKYAPEGAKIVVVDDASAYPIQEATYRFEQNVGIARAKNKCLELLDDCDHIFLFDDDTYPITQNWHQPYIESREPHLMYIFEDFAVGSRLNDNSLLYRDDELKAFAHPRGCMLYLERRCLDVVGGMDPIFGKWGWEHVDLSVRIHNAGLTTFKFADVVGSERLFYSADEHKAVNSTVLGRERMACIQENREVYEARRDSSQYVPYKAHRNVIITTFFTAHADCQRNIRWEADHSKLDVLIESVKANGEHLVVLHDCFDLPDSDNVHYVKVDSITSPYWQRWLSIYRYLQANSDIYKAFCVDATDVEMQQSPFRVMEPDYLYIGDEPVPLNNEWMRNHFPATFLQRFIAEQGNKTLLNAGLVGGTRQLLLKFLGKLISKYIDNKIDVLSGQARTVGEIDMGLLNYVAYTYFAEHVSHGRHVNTVFKQYEYNNISWFKHK